jgi:hypothetical protein
LELSCLQNIGIESRLARVKVSEETVVVDGSDGKEDLRPSESRNGINGGNTVGDIRASKTRGNVERKTVEFRHNVTDDGKHGNAAVLELGRAVLVECLLVNVGTQASGVPESRRLLCKKEMKEIKLGTGLPTHIRQGQ